MKTKEQMLEDREVAKLSEELWELSEHGEQNMKRMKEIASILVYKYNHPDIQDSEPEKKKPRICREWLQIEHCKDCLFEVLCNLKHFNSQQ